MLHHTRRAFMKSMTVGGTAVAIMQWPPALEARMAGGDPVQPPASPGWGSVPGQARFRIDGLAKVTGQKIYARDFHASDIPGWPRSAMYVSLLRAVRTDAPFVRVDVDRFPKLIRPSLVILQSDLDKANIKTPWFDGLNFSVTPSLMVERGQMPIYLGQPVAMLFFDDEQTWRAAERQMQFDPGFIEYGVPDRIPACSSVLGDPYYFIRYTENGTELFSQVLAESSSIDPTGTTPVDLEAKKYQDKINMLIATAPQQGWRVFESTTATQTIDPMFMEPQTGMAYMRMVGTKRELDIVVGTQSPNGDVSTLCSSVLLGADNHPDFIRLYSCYPGGGFGGRDTSLFTYFLAIAAAFAPGRPIRLEFDRFGQFQSGIKRNGSFITQTFAVDANGKLQAVRSNMTIVGGGKMNYSPFVAELAGICGAGAYAVPMNDIVATARQTIGPTAGSMRGFGGPQAFFAVEHLMDEIAAGLRIDPIDLRMRNALEQGDSNVCGAPLTSPLALREICELAKRNPLWVNRDAEKRRREGGDTLYGVGFALANQAYGTGKDPVLGNVAIQPDGSVTVTTTAVDMGNGSATSLALATARWLGTNASSIEMGNVAFTDVLNLTTATSGQPVCMPGSVIAPPCPPPKPSSSSSSAMAEPKMAEVFKSSRGGHAKLATVQKLATGAKTNPWDNPCYTSSAFASSSACITAFQQTHIIDQTAQLLFATGIWPAAVSLWKLDASAKSADARWANGNLVLRDLRPLSLRELAAEAYRLGVTTGVTAHALYQGQWVTADWTINGAAFPNLPIDLLAIRSGSGPYSRILRSKVYPPPAKTAYYGRSLYAPSGTLAAVEVNKRSGAVKLLDIVTYVDAGRPIQRELLAGQYEGAVAMGFGYTFLESMPQGGGGPGDGTWNLNRYGLALAGDLPPLERMKLVTLREDTTPKGIAEAVLCPIPPALANAVTHATGRFFRSLPIKAAELAEVAE